ncbi:MAG TPA: Uma2 family endonuclease [Chloroflexota bacterium]|nr:Uma2 family endonuclease [Chloroflexota bacterium]
MVTRARATVEDVLRAASAGQRCELVDGELLDMSPTGVTHGRIELHIGRLFADHVDEYDLGLVVAGEVLFRLTADGTLARAADVAFIHRDRVGSAATEDGPFDGAPDVAVEVVSPGDSASDVERKVDDWLTHGTRVVLVVYPRGQRVVLARPNGAVTLRGDDLVDLDPELPGFHCKVSDLFPGARAPRQPR